MQSTDSQSFYQIFIQPSNRYPSYKKHFCLVEAPMVILFIFQLVFAFKGYWKESETKCGAVWIDFLLGDGLAYLLIVILDIIYLFAFSVYKHYDISYPVAARYIRIHWIIYIVLWCCRLAIHSIAADYLVYHTNDCEYNNEYGECVTIQQCDLNLWRMVLASVIVYFLLCPVISFHFPIVFAFVNLLNVDKWKHSPLQGIDLRDPVAANTRKKDKYHTPDIIAVPDEVKQDPFSSEYSPAVSPDPPEWLPPKIPDFELGGRMSPVDVNRDKGIPMNQQEKYRTQFVLVVGSIDGFMSGYQTQAIFAKSGLKDEDLANLWILADIDYDYSLNMHEYIVFAFLVDYVMVRKEFLSAVDVEILRASITV